jgi:hypothetical protein
VEKKEESTWKMKVMEKNKFSVNREKRPTLNENECASDKESGVSLSVRGMAV